jgi:hypothetical protein
VMAGKHLRTQHQSLLLPASRLIGLEPATDSAVPRRERYHDSSAA